MKNIVITTILTTTTFTSTATTATLVDVVGVDSFSLQQVCIMNEHSRHSDTHVEVPGIKLKNFQWFPTLSFSKINSTTKNVTVHLSKKAIAMLRAIFW